MTGHTKNIYLNVKFKSSSNWVLRKVFKNHLAKDVLNEKRYSNNFQDPREIIQSMGSLIFGPRGFIREFSEQLVLRLFQNKQYSTKRSRINILNHSLFALTTFAFAYCYELVFFVLLGLVFPTLLVNAFTFAVTAHLFMMQHSTNK